ncbi:MAG: dihydroorotate dehydrogenase electron transfer subunit, partial [Planctomycetota bacterium]
TTGRQKMTPASVTCNTSPLAAKHYADAACFSPAAVIENVRTARDTYRMRIATPAIAERILPGQFIMVRLAGATDPMLGRAFAVYDVVRGEEGTAEALDFVYLKKGNLTTPLSACLPGATVEAWGPLGNGFQLPATDHLIMVAGGIGQTPFLALGKQYLGADFYGDCDPADQPHPRRATLCYGVRTAELLAGEADFRGAGIDLRVASDDGSVGHHGLVTELLERALDEPAEQPHVACCGPEPMMQAVAEVCARRGVGCQVSLETPMACGIGICFSCVARVRQEEGPGGEPRWDYKRTCVDGPVFDAQQIVW